MPAVSLLIVGPPCCCSQQGQGQAQALAMSQYLECTDPSVADLDYNLPLEADIIITGVVVAAGPGRALCQAPAVNATGGPLGSWLPGRSSQ
jgi:hypothetical protein